MKLDPVVRHPFRTDVTKVLNNKINSSQRSVDSTVLKSDNSSIIITKADKGSCVVIVYKSVYVDKVLQLLNENSTYTIFVADRAPSIQSKFNRLLVTMKIVDKFTVPLLRL